MRWLLLIPALAACAPQPMTRAEAEASCRAELRRADGVSGVVGVGVGSDGPDVTGQITVTDRVFSPQTPADFLRGCVDRRMAGRPEPTTFGVSVGNRS